MHLIAIAVLALGLYPVPEQTKAPAAPTPESIANGGKLYGRYCAACHGKEGKGDGPGGAKLSPAPSNFTDDEWKHGPSDAEILLVIRDGVKETGMKAYGSRVTEREMADLLSYIRSLKH